ncbi:MAG: hypothetical protein QM811_13205 [Pirellulales bacterium]
MAWNVGGALRRVARVRQSGRSEFGGGGRRERLARAEDHRRGGLGDRPADVRIGPRAKENPARALAEQTYTVAADVPKTFDFIKGRLLADKWKELPNTQTGDGYANATFARSGYRLSLSVTKLGEKEHMVVLHNHGNVKLTEIPVPAGAKQMYAFPVTVAYVTEKPAAETSAEMTKLLAAQGWTPYESAGDKIDYKRGLSRIGVNVMAAPAQGGKTVIQLSSALLSFDAPLPEGSDDPRYTEHPPRLTFNTKMEQDALYGYYKKEFEQRGWKPTTDNPIVDGRKAFQIYRDDAKDLVEVETVKSDDGLRVSVRYQTAAELEAETQRAKAAAEKARKEREEANK